MCDYLLLKITKCPAQRDHQWIWRRISKPVRESTSFGISRAQSIVFIYLSLSRIRPFLTGVSDSSKGGAFVLIMTGSLHIIYTKESDWLFVSISCPLPLVHLHLSRVWKHQLLVYPTSLAARNGHVCASQWDPEGILHGSFFCIFFFHTIDSGHSFPSPISS